ncbi:Nonsense-mediated decay protein Upf3 [Phaffia rhodozyma]|uniref:Nonsense-mediated decay protein Upf3 n=1 Tax=Phaffia rhodozyma TaxID=264483 RepID=A0A0F7SV13_PHARH|nr:Nonsense-mediated decay protein Upf3 [Phaffia rhodozyma]
MQASEPPPPKSSIKKSQKVQSEPSSSSSYQQQQQQQVKLKIVIRRLPANLPEELFWQSVKPWVNEQTVSWKFYRKGKLAKSVNKETVHSRAYVLFKSTPSLVTFHREYDGHLFRDKQGNESNAVVEYAVYQKVPTDRKKGDRKQGSIDIDPDYLSFLESLKAPAKTVVDGEMTSQAVATAAAATLSSGAAKPKLTPLLEHLKARKEGKSHKHGSPALSGMSTPRGAKAILAPPPNGQSSGKSKKGDKKDKGKGKSSAGADKKDKATGSEGAGGATDANGSSTKRSKKQPKQHAQSSGSSAPGSRLQPPEPAALQAMAAASLAARQQQQQQGRSGEGGGGGGGGGNRSGAQSPAVGEANGTGPPPGASRSKRREKRGDGGKKEAKEGGGGGGTENSSGPPVQFKILKREATAEPSPSSASIPSSSTPSDPFHGRQPGASSSRALNPNLQVFEPQQSQPPPVSTTERVRGPRSGRGGLGGGGGGQQQQQSGGGGGGGGRGGRGGGGGRGAKGGRGRGQGPPP